MLQKNDFLNKQIALVYSEHGKKCILKIRNNNFAFLKDGKVVNQMPANNAQAIIVVGDIAITTYLINHAKKHGTTLILLSNTLKHIQTFNASAEGNYLIRQKQYTLNSKEEHTISKAIIGNKLLNQQIIANKVSPGSKITGLENYNESKSYKSLLGVEGSAAKHYYSILFKDLDGFKRIPRAKPDITNLLLDVGYSMLFGYIESLATCYGFDLYKGVYHKLFFERKSLICDFVEPFRSVIDYEVYKMHLLNKVNNQDFIKNYDGRYTLKWQSSKDYQALFMNAILKDKLNMYKTIKSIYYMYFNIENNVYEPFIINQANKNNMEVKGDNRKL